MTTFTTKNIILKLFVMIVIIFITVPAYAIYGNYGDIMVLYAPGPIVDPIGVRVERDARTYEEMLLHLQIPQYAMGNRILDEALIRNEFFYHTEICERSREYEDFWGMTWCAYKFTDWALQLLSVDQVIDVELWIARDNEEKYKIPFEETSQLYTRYIHGDFDHKHVPIELMIGTKYGQTIEEYSNFKNFYSFMNKHHYCVTVCFWAIQKSMYDYGDAAYKKAVEDALSDPQRVQSFDSLLASRLVGLLKWYGLIERYQDD